MSTASCAGVITTDVDGIAYCTDGLGTAVTWQEVAPFDPSDIDASVAGEAFAIGFIMYGTAFAIGKGVALLLRTINLL